MAEDIISRNQLSITIISFPILLLLFAVMFVISQPAFPYTIETAELLWNPHEINDYELTDAVVLKDQQFHPILVDDAVGEWKKSFGIFEFPKIQNSEIVDVQYHPPPYFLPPSYYLPTPPRPPPHCPHFYICGFR